jgi:hypothetical protein
MTGFSFISTEGSQTRRPGSPLDEELASTTRRLAAFGSSKAADRTVPMYGLTAVFDAFLEPDPGADWAPDAITARRQLWRETARALYEM